MKLTTALLLSNTPLIVAFTPPRPQTLSPRQSFQFQPAEQPRSLSLPLFPDPSSLESSTMLTSELVNPFVDFLGGISLFGSIGYGIFVGKNQTDWDYEYQPGNEEAKDKYGDKDLTDAQKDFFGSDSTPSPAPEPKPEPPAPAPKPRFFKKKKPAPPAPEPPAPEPPAPKPPAPKPAASKPPTPAPSINKEIENAKKDILENKLPAPKPAPKPEPTKPAPKPAPVTPVETKEPEPPTPEPTPEPPAPVVEQKEKKKGGLKRKLVQSATFLTVAGALAVTRKIVISWLGKGIL